PQVVRTAPRPPPPEQLGGEGEGDKRRRDGDVADGRRHQKVVVTPRTKLRPGSGRKNDALAASAYSTLPRLFTPTVMSWRMPPNCQARTPARTFCTVNAGSASPTGLAPTAMSFCSPFRRTAYSPHHRPPDDVQRNAALSLLAYESPIGESGALTFVDFNVE